jgi:hypothetical protein
MTEMLQSLSFLSSSLDSDFEFQTAAVAFIRRYEQVRQDTELSSSVTSNVVVSSPAFRSYPKNTQTVALASHRAAVTYRRSAKK